MKCQKCKAEIKKVSVVGRAFLHLDNRTRENVDEKYYCPKCKQEFDTQNLLALTLDTFERI